MLMPKQKSKTQQRILFVDELPAFARQLSRSIFPGDCICLSGDLGTGKTSLVHALLQGWGLPEGAAFSSPTFTILNSYDFAQHSVHHIDLYRLATFSEVENLDLIPLLESPQAVTLIEWGNKFPELLPFYGKKIHFEYLKGRALDRMVEFEGFN